MARYCQACSKKLPIFSIASVCKECKAAQEASVAEKKAQLAAEFRSVQREIVENKDITEQQIERLRKRDRASLIKLYSEVYEEFEANKELDESELDTLKKMQAAFGLTNEEVEYHDRVCPYVYVLGVKNRGTLPTMNLQVEGGSSVVLKKGEVVHFADSVVLKEIKSINLGYSGGSHGISLPIGAGIRYRVGAHRGSVKREDRLVETSRGTLIISNQRLFLHPAPGHKPLSIPLNKILSYQCFGNGVEVYKDGREKGYFLSIARSGSVEVFGLCLGHLLAQ